MKNVCPSCRSGELYPVAEYSGVPANSCMLLGTAEEARAVPVGDLAIRVCLSCGLYFNAAYDPSLCHYDESYEETQGYSPSFRAYLEALVDDLIERHQIKDRDLLEVGCGKGEFLALLCARGNNAGTGYDPAFRADRHPAPELGRLRFFSENFVGHGANATWDAIITRMTLEHIPDVADFLGGLRAGLPSAPAPLLYTQVPNSAHLAEKGLVCDLVYEHCNYFTERSLSNALGLAGFEVASTIVGFDGQHLAAEAYPVAPAPPLRAIGAEIAKREADALRARLAGHVDRWNAVLKGLRDAGKRAVIWGSGSKATAFLTMHDSGEEILGVVDINPNREGTYMAGTGHAILGPMALSSGGAMHPVDAVIVMNPIYTGEIQEMLRSMELDPEFLSL